MFQTKDILCSGVQMTRQGRVRPRRQLIIILVEQVVGQLGAAEDADAANAEKTPKKNDVSATITLFCSAAGAEGVEQDVAGVAAAAVAKLVAAKLAGAAAAVAKLVAAKLAVAAAAVAKLVVAKLAAAAAVAKHAPTATQNH